MRALQNHSIFRSKANNCNSRVFMNRSLRRPGGFSQVLIIVKSLYKKTDSKQHESAFYQSTILDYYVFRVKRALTLSHF